MPRGGKICGALFGACRRAHEWAWAGASGGDIFAQMKARRDGRVYRDHNDEERGRVLAGMGGASQGDWV
jgi:hypothetical protein